MSENYKFSQFFISKYVFTMQLLHLSIVHSLQLGNFYEQFLHILSLESPYYSLLHSDSQVLCLVLKKGFLQVLHSVTSHVLQF